MTAVSHDQPAETIDPRAWINTSFHGELEARYADNIKKVALQDKDRSLSIHLEPALATRLALALLRAAREGGADVTEHIRDAVMELTEPVGFVALVQDDLKAWAEAEAEMENDPTDEDWGQATVITWDEYQARLQGRQS